MHNLVGDGYQQYLEEQDERDVKRRRRYSGEQSLQVGRRAHVGDYIKGSSLTMADVNLIRLVGRGAFGEVWLAQNLKTDRFVALKKYYYGEDRDGFNKACLREIALLRTLGNHPNIVPFHGVIFALPAKYGPLSLPYPMSDAEYRQIFKAEGPYGIDCCASEQGGGKAGLWLAFDFYPFDLNAYMRSRDESNNPSGANATSQELPLDEVKWITKGCLKALEHCHENHVLHRDIKSANILLDYEGNVRLADFGLARRVTFPRGSVLVDDILAQPIDLSCEMDPRMTNKVVTLWYRAPELLLGGREYTSSSDMWSLGCLVYEMMAGKPLFSANNEQQMIQLIFDKMHIPPDWTHEASQLPLYSYLRSYIEQEQRTNVDQNYEALKQKVAAAGGGSDASDFLFSLLAVNPNHRITATEALKHPWLVTEAEKKGNLSGPFAGSQRQRLIMEQAVKGNSVTIRKERERLMNMQKQHFVRHINSSNPPTSTKKVDIQNALKKLQDDIKAKTQQIATLSQFLTSTLQDCPESQLEEGEID